jgi:hypothetical protein
MKYTRSNKKNGKRSYYLGGTSFYQKGVAAQLRSSMPHNSELRRKLNEIVHSGDFYESKERNSFLDLNNHDDAEAQKVLSEAIDYIKNHKDLSSKIKKRVLQGIVPITVPTTTTGYHKTSTKRMRTQSPTKTNKTNRTSTATNAIFMNRSRMRTRKMFKR